MREQEVRELYEAYMQVHQPQEEVEELDEAEIMKHQKERGAIERRKKMKGYEPPTKGVHGEIERRQAKKPPSKLRSGSLPESYDLFDTILEYLVSEGYADTNESALVIMANMSEEWKESILSEEPVQDFRDMMRSKENAAGMRGPELTHSAKPAGSAAGSTSKKPQPRSREFSHGN
jgi:hypothetical protein